ncbi:MAG TPA: hypothetical protein PLZ36_05800 [Armatimonadota bacterium]|nr:hypothetical protein [Armatimonadota bacterium]HOS42705.1 hypothetical protein [Armatimonadota bacterium]
MDEEPREMPIPVAPPPPIPPAGQPSTTSSPAQVIAGFFATLLFNGAIVLALLMGLGEWNFPVVLLVVAGMLLVNAAGIAVARAKHLPLVSTGIFTVAVLTALLLALPLYALWSCQYGAP